MTISRLNASSRALYEYLKDKSVDNEIKISIQEILDDLPKLDGEKYSAQGLLYLLNVLKKEGAISVKMRGFRTSPTVYQLNY